MERGGFNQHQTGQTTPENQQSPLKQSLTIEELQVLKECNRESFYYRCVPFSILFMGTTQALVTKGYLKPHPRFGAILKNMGSGLFGYFVGKISYQDTCRQKILQLENSPLADSMRGKMGEPHDVQGSWYGAVEPQAPAPGQKRIGDDYNTKDFDTDSNNYNKGLDVSKQPNADSSRQSPDDQSKTQPFVSYNDLREQNRLDYEAKRFGKGRQPQQQQPSQDSSTSYPQVEPPTPIQSSDTFSSAVTSNETRRITSSEPTSSQPKKYVRRNQYGDVVEE